MGRPKRANNLKVLHGDQSRKGVVAGEYHGDAPIPPDDLAPEARAEWDRVVKVLASQGRLATIDRGMLVMYCDYIRLERETAATLEREGYTIVSAQGATAAHPLTIINARYARLAMALADRFGLTTRAREALQPAAPPKDEKKAKYFG